AGALLLAAAMLGRREGGGRLRALLTAPAAALKSVHDGEVGDYVLWLTVGLVALGLAWAVTLT
ncbi:MAG TPA: hypothetical protein VFH77_04970, partial [Streptomyces sp.]|nr:hypothetical protein [Streptomyces sp.]